MTWCPKCRRWSRRNQRLMTHRRYACHRCSTRFFAEGKKSKAVDD